VRAVLIVAAATAVAGAARAALHVPDVEMLFLLAVAVVSITSARGPSIFAAMLCVAAYDFFFVAPRFTFGVEDVRYVLTFAMMLGIGVVMSNLMLRLRAQERAAVARERQTAALYEASRGLATAVDAPGVAAVCARVAEAVVGAPAVLFGREGEDALTPLSIEPAGAALAAPELEVVHWTAARGTVAGAGSGPFAGRSVVCLPVRAAVEVTAVLAVRLPVGGGVRAEDREFLEALCHQCALALERVRLAAKARAAALRAEAERLRSALLSAVSHDLRTPLATITGAATALRDGLVEGEDARRELVGAICDEAERLERRVRNLLDMTRLESGEVQLRRDWVPVEEVVGGALTCLERQLAGRPVMTQCGDDLPLLHVDPVLLEQLFVNVIENAAKYTPAGTPVEISARAEGARVVIEIADRGPGIPAGMEERVFERFRRGAPGSAPGVGLGLAIARAIAEAHGGTLEAENRPGGGATFRMSLPAAERPPMDGAEGKNA
jgi:two-component system sensor histidine kinase KdpD